MLASQRSGLNKEGLGYNGSNPFINNNKILKRPKSIELKCKYCSFHGHTIRKCPIRNGKPYRIKKVWVPKGTIKTNLLGPKTIWVPKKDLNICLV